MKDVSFEQKYNQAKKRVKRLKEFYVHLFTYVVVNFMLLIINIVTSPSYWWFIFPLLGWGIGLFLQGITLVVSKYGEQWEERKIRKLLLEEND